MIFDESHNAGGSVPKIKDGGRSSRTAPSVPANWRSTPRHSAATHGKLPEVMDLYFNTDPSRNGAFPTINLLILGPGCRRLRANPAPS